MIEPQIDRIESARMLLHNVAAEQGWSEEGQRVRVSERFHLEIKCWTSGIVVACSGRNWRVLEGNSDQIQREKILELSRLLQHRQRQIDQEAERKAQEAKRQAEHEQMRNSDRILMDVVADRFEKHTGCKLDSRVFGERTGVGGEGTVVKHIAIDSLTAHFTIHVPSSVAIDVYEWLSRLDWLDRYNSKAQSSLPSDTEWLDLRDQPPTSLATPAPRA